MPESGLAAIVEDDDGNFWFPGREMLRVSRADLDAVADGRKRAVNPETFGRAAGMRIGSEFAFGATPAVWKGRGNKLYFATYGGMVEIDVARVTVNRRPPPVLIERVTDGRQNRVGAGGWIRAGSSSVTSWKASMRTGWMPATGAPLTIPTFQRARSGSAWWRAT
jgi:hypothetical protein